MVACLDSGVLGIMSCETNASVPTAYIHDSANFIYMYCIMITNARCSAHRGLRVDQPGSESEKKTFSEHRKSEAGKDNPMSKAKGTLWHIA